MHGINNFDLVRDVHAYFGRAVLCALRDEETCLRVTHSEDSVEPLWESVFLQVNQEV